MTFTLDCLWIQDTGLSLWTSHLDAHKHCKTQVMTFILPSSGNISATGLPLSKSLGSRAQAKTMKLKQWSNVCLILSFVLDASGMFSKRPLLEPSSDPSKRLRQNLRDLFVSNDVSGARGQTLFDDAHLAGAAHVRDIASRSSKGTARGNAARNLKNKFKSKIWPALYTAQIRQMNKKTGLEVERSIGIMLPHELLATLCRFNRTSTKLMSTDNLCKSSMDNLLRAQLELGTAQLLPLGMWCDGTPSAWDRSESLEIWSPTSGSLWPASWAGRPWLARVRCIEMQFGLHPPSILVGGVPFQAAV